MNPTIGLEVHVQLQTGKKLFCSCPSDFAAPPNTRVCPVCLGLPGTLPVLNQEAVILALRAALVLGCTINTLSSFDRKHYFYPDLPKGYQITQQRQPLAIGGRVETPLGIVDIKRLHLEEDAAKLVHTAEGTLIDYNRSGIALVEIVTAPCLTSPGAAKSFLQFLRQVLLYAGISDCKLEEGSLRCDANISLQGGGRTEIKNLNSFKAVERALVYEIQRQRRAIARGEKVRPETLRWDEAQAKTVPMRAKGIAAEYLYLPEPDLPPLHAAAALVEKARMGLPELPRSRAARFVRQYGLPPERAELLTATREMADCFEEIAAKGATPLAAANLLLGEVSRLLNAGGELPAAGQLARLLALQEAGSISVKAAKEVLARMSARGESVDNILKQENFFQISDTETLAELAQKVIAANPGATADFLGGKKKALGFLMGAAMKASQGRANPELLKEMLAQKLAEGSKKY